jgi:hypothetical protein
MEVIGQEGHLVDIMAVLSLSFLSVLPFFHLFNLVSCLSIRQVHTRGVIVAGET